MSGRAEAGKPFALACASHTPLVLRDELADATVSDAVRASFARLGSFVAEFAADRIIQFAPDHFHGFHYDNMPSFCVGAGARSFGDWGHGAARFAGELAGQRGHHVRAPHHTRRRGSRASADLRQDQPVHRPPLDRRPEARQVDGDPVERCAGR